MFLSSIPQFKINLLFLIFMYLLVRLAILDNKSFIYIPINLVIFVDCFIFFRDKNWFSLKWIFTSNLSWHILTKYETNIRYRFFLPSPFSKFSKLYTLFLIWIGGSGANMLYIILSISVPCATLTCYIFLCLVWCLFCLL